MERTLRNISCPEYGRCLDDQARADTAGWDCSACDHAADHADHAETEFIEYWLLLWGVFKPELLRLYRQAQGQEALRSRSRQGAPAGRDAARPAQRGRRRMR